MWEQEQLRRGVCAGGMFYICFSHTEEDVRRTVEVCTEALHVVKKALDAGDATPFLLGREKQDGFRRLV